jgi:hypothetical protein
MSDHLSWALNLQFGLACSRASFQLKQNASFRYGNNPQRLLELGMKGIPRQTSGLLDLALTIMQNFLE